MNDYQRFKLVLAKHESQLREFNKVIGRQLCLQSNKWHWEKIQCKKRVEFLREFMTGLEPITVW